jgi:hypothetical protein
VSTETKETLRALLLGTALALAMTIYALLAS